MDQYKYNILPIDPESITTIDTLSIADVELILDFKVNSSFNSSTDYIELHYYTLDGRILSSIDYYTNYKTSQDSETANEGTLNTVELGIEDDIIVSGYTQGDINVIYNFLSDPYTENYLKTFFFIEEISSDRTELRLLPVTLENQQVVELTAKVKQTLENPSTGDLKVNLGDNRLLLALNIDTLPYRDYNSVVVKLYNPLPGDIDVKDKISIAIEVSDPAAYNITAVLEEQQPTITYLKGPNFKVDGDVNTSFPSEYLSIQEAFNYQVTSSYYQVKSIFEEKGAELSIDYSDYNNFINFSSAEERLKNFKYKVDLISSYQSELDSKTIYTSSSLVYSGSKSYYEDLINNILSNFDHYDRFLYYESSSYSWPKSGIRQPYNLITGSAATGSGSWYELQTASASLFDSTNSNLLLNTIPTFLRDDPANNQYTIFVHMVAQHFDNIWIYAKAVTEKYNADNRLDVGISKDLIDDALRNFGVKLYTSNKSTQELFRMFTGDFYEISADEFGDRLPSASFITGSDAPTSEEDYRKQIYKRLYHNLPLLLKSKGTERGVRALLSSFGIPSLYSITSGSVLPVQQYGGTLTSDSNFGGQSLISSSEDKIRLDNTGSIVGNTLSAYTSIIKRDKKYSLDNNLAEVGFSPTTYINELILASGSLEDFNIDQILGDPGFAYSSSYEGLTVKAEQYLSGSITKRYNLKDFTRLLKFYDNVVFKTVRDFLPAKLDAATGIIIKPHLLERSKVPQVRTAVERHNDLSGSIAVSNITGSSGDTFGGQNQYSSSYIVQEMSPDGLASSDYHNYETAKYDGEFSGSYLQLSTGELNDENTFKYDSSVALTFAYNFIDADRDCNVVWGEWQPPLVPTPAPTTPAPTTPAPTTPAPTTPSPIEPVTPAPTTPAPVTPGPVTPEPTPAPVTPAPITCEIMSNVGVGFTSLGENEVDACTQVILNQFGSDSTSLATATILYSSTTCTSLASPGHYAQGGSWRYWNGTQFTDSGDCPTQSPVTPEPTTPEPVTPEPTTPEPTTPEPTTPTPVADPLYYRFVNCDTSELVFQAFEASTPNTGDRYTDGTNFFIRDASNPTDQPGTVVTNLTPTGQTGCPPEPTPAPASPQTVKAQITQCGGSTTYYVEITNYSSLPNNFAIEATNANLTGACWEIIDNSYTGPVDFITEASAIYTSCVSCSPTPAPVTPAPTTPAPVVLCTSQEVGVGSTEQQACDDYANGLTTTAYMDSILIAASVVYRDSNCGPSLASAGYYSNGTEVRYWDGSSFGAGSTCGGAGGGEL